MHYPEERPALSRVWELSARLLGLLSLWFGLMRLFPFEVAALERTFARYAWLPPVETAPALSLVLAVLESGIGLVLLLAPRGTLRKGAALAAMLFWGAGLALLFGAAAWIHDPPYGGFPVIGSGQTLLKHLGIAALAMGLYARERGCPHGRRRALYLLWAGQLLVLVWIGLMKFTPVEAQGVAGLMRPSPLFAWLYGPFGEQGASNLIGAIELATAASIALWPWRPALARGGLWLAIGTYVFTNTFLFTTPGWEPGYGFPYVGGTGQFLLKDLLLLAGAAVLLLSEPPSRVSAGAVRRPRA